jgi:hypothetical protein
LIENKTFDGYFCSDIYTSLNTHTAAAIFHSYLPHISGAVARGD